MKRTKLDKTLLFIMIVFSVFGLIMVLSASSMSSYMRYHNTIYNYFIKQGIFMIVGLISFLIALYFPTKLFKKISFPVTLLLMLSLVGLLVYGEHYATARSWYYVGPFSIQPSEIIKVFIILYLANYYDVNKNNLDNQWVLIKPIIPCVIIFFLIAMQPDFGTAFIILLIVLAIFYAIPIKNSSSRKMITRLLLISVLSIFVYAILTGGSFLRDYQLQRFNFLNPCDRYQEESGYQLCNSLIAFKNGGLFGKGIGESTQKYMYLPEAHTDFIFPIIVEEWGLLVGIIIIVLYAYMIYIIMKISKRANNLGNSILAFGIGIYFLSHIIINLIGVMGLGPLTGVPLPFLSYGGSYTITIFFAMGLLQRVHYEGHLQDKKRKY